MVLAGFVTAWRLASWPTSRSPVLVKATTDGTVRPPSADAMTVGSPPSITATTLFVVPRSMPMIFAMCRVSPWLVVGGSVRECLVDGSIRSRAVGRGRHRDEGRSDDAVAEPVAAPDLLDDLALGPPRARDGGDRLVIAGVERRARRRVDLAHALAFQQRPQLAVDRNDAVDPGVVGRAFGSGLDRTVEVVGQHEDLADQVLTGQPEHRLALLAGPPAVVGELGSLALQPGQVLVGPGLGRGEVGLQLLDVCEELGRRDVDLGGPLLRSGALAHAVPPVRR